MSDFKALAQAQRITGYRIRLRDMETIETVEITDSRVVVLINRCKVKPVRGGFEITRRGTELHTFNRTATGWKALEPVAVWWSTSETHTSQPTRTRDQAWEDMCYRPGTSRTPLDNPARMRQGYDY